MRRVVKMSPLKHLETACFCWRKLGHKKVVARNCHDVFMCKYKVCCPRFKCSVSRQLPVEHCFSIFYVQSDYGSIVQRRSSSDIIDLDQTNFGITPSSANLARLNNGAGGYNISPTRQSSERIRDVMEEDSSDDDDMDSTGAAYSGKKGDTVKLVI